MTRVLGLDLSLTSTGVATATNGILGQHYQTWRLKPTAKLTRHERLRWLVDRISEHADGVNLVVVEGPSYGSEGRGQHERAGLWWLVTHFLWREHVTVAIAPPATLKRYATGKGNAGKDDVLREVVRRFPAFEGGNDEADALVLAAMGIDQLGTPVVTMPATHRAALSSVEWPTDLAAKDGQS